MDDERNSAAAGTDFDESDATVVDDFTGGVAAQLGRGVASVAQHLGRYGDSLGGLAIDIGRIDDPAKRADALRMVHACGQNVARYLREALEHVGAANELIGKAASRARAIAAQAPQG